MTLEEIIVLIFYIVILTVMMICYKLYRHWRKKHDDAVEMWKLETRNKNEQILKLQEELKTHKDMERVIKIEQVHLQPRELECKFSIHPRFVEDTERFKKILVAETARYIAEEIERDPFLCKVYHSVRPFDCQENIMVHFRLLPYAEGVVWDDLFKKEEE